MNTAVTDKLISWHETALTRPEFGFVGDILRQHETSQVYLVGGAVRDIILGRETKDYDFVVAGIPASDLEKFLSERGEVNLVGKSFGVFKFVPADYDGEAIDIALPRTEHAGMSGGYRDVDVQSDPHLPIEDDLGRRDFTINALAWDLRAQRLVDAYDGLADLADQTIRAIGDPVVRFQEDYTRMLRAPRFAAQLGFTIDPATAAVIQAKASAVADVATERVTEELTKIILSPGAGTGIRLLQELGLLAVIIPELTSAMGVGQNKAHIYDVYEHLVRALEVAVERGYGLEIRLAALFHDIGKPATKAGDGKESTFYNHDQVGATMTKQILQRLRYPNDVTKKVVHLVRYHMFYYALDSVTDAGVRRLLNRLGREHVEDFIAVRICDRLGMGRPKAKPWKLIELERRFKEVQLDPITPKMLAIDGLEIMRLLDIKPSKRVGLLLGALLGDVLEEPVHNTPDHLRERAHQLHQLSDNDLAKLQPDITYYDEERKRLLHARG